MHSLCCISNRKKKMKIKHVKNKNVTKYHSMLWKRLFPVGISACKNNTGTGMKNCCLRMAVPKADGSYYNKKIAFVSLFYLTKLRGVMWMTLCSRWKGLTLQNLLIYCMWVIIRYLKVIKMLLTMALNSTKKKILQCECVMWYFILQCLLQILLPIVIIMTVSQYQTIKNNYSLCTCISLAFLILPYVQYSSSVCTHNLQWTWPHSVFPLP